MIDKIESLKSRLVLELPGISSHVEFYPMRFNTNTKIDTSNFLKAVVAIHIVNEEENLLTRRVNIDILY